MPPAIQSCVLLPDSAACGRLGALRPASDCERSPRRVRSGWSSFSWLPQCVHIREKVVEQPFEVDEQVSLFAPAQVAVIALSPLVAIAHQPTPGKAIEQSIFVAVSTSGHRSFQGPYFCLDDGPVVVNTLVMIEQPDRHVGNYANSPSLTSMFLARSMFRFLKFRTSAAPRESNPPSSTQLLCRTIAPPCPIVSGMPPVRDRVKTVSE